MEIYDYDRCGLEYFSEHRFDYGVFNVSTVHDSVNLLLINIIKYKFILCDDGESKLTMFVQGEYRHRLRAISKQLTEGSLWSIHAEGFFCVGWTFFLR